MLLVDAGRNPAAIFGDDAPDCVELMGEILACAGLGDQRLEVLWVDSATANDLRPRCGLPAGQTWRHHCVPHVLVNLTLDPPNPGQHRFDSEV